MADLTGCPLPIDRYPKIVMAHGAGGRLTRALFDGLFRPGFENPYLNAAHDGAILPNPNRRIAISTDSHVVKPLFFPGGDIGKLAVFGTVNDLAMCGARPMWLGLGLILEEGLEVETLSRVVASIREASDEAGVTIVTGDTKVIDRKGEGELFIHTTGIGVVEHEGILGPLSIRPDDQILLSGDIGRHGIAVLAAREGLDFEIEIESDCASLHEIVGRLTAAGLPIHCLRDPTRGGLASALIELAMDSRTSFSIFEEKIPIHPSVKGACELLGIDPFYVACEGRFVAIVPPQAVDETLVLMRSHPLGQNASVIGRVLVGEPGRVIVENAYGGRRVLDLLTGDPLPRIC